jgi:hypothetical protein
MDGSIRGSLTLAICALAVLAAACGSSGPPRIDYEEGDAATTADGLRRVRSYRVGAAFVRPGASLESYRRIKLADVTVSYKRPPRVESDRALEQHAGSRGNYALSERNMQRLEDEFQKVFEDELRKSEVFEVVDEAGPDVLLVAGHIVDLVVEAPGEGSAGRDRVWVKQSGEMTLVLDVRDSQSNAALARMADRRAVQAGGGNTPYRSDAVSNTSAVRTLFRRWARQLREALDGLHQLPEIPEAPSQQGDSAK